MKKYILTEEHKKELKPWAEKWIANGLSTKPMDDEDKKQMRIAIKGLYESAGLKAPPESRIIFVTSPFVIRFAGGFAASILYSRKKYATRAATRDATRDATDYATRTAIDTATRTAIDTATRDATFDATRDAIDTAIDAATDYATRTAIDTATRTAIDAATYDATRAATRDATRTAINKKHYTETYGLIDAGLRSGVGKFGFECADSSWRMCSGGNFWSGTTCFLSFFKDIVKLPLDYTKYEFWEKATIHGSYRIMHPEFCMISDRPRVLKLDDQGRPHCEDGPYIQWSDGMGMYAWHGTMVPEYWIMQRDLLTATDALKWDNVEQRRVACEIVGWNNILKNLNAKTIQKDDDPQIGELVEVEIPEVGTEKFLRVTCGTGREFALPVPPNMETALQANAWTYGIEDFEYKPEIRT